VSDYPTRPLDFERYSEDEMRRRATEMLDEMARRRSVREFSADPVPGDVLAAIIHTAGQAPSGANKQPWTFVLVTEPETKRRIREAAEEEERKFYAERATAEWLADLAHLGTDSSKPFLETAPALIIAFAQTKPPDGAGGHYYVKESVGLACGFLIAAIHHAGLVTLTHTPSPMSFLGKVLGRPDNERAFLLLPVGYPAADAEVPDISRKPLDQILVEV
jgi:nitroreductase